MPLSIIRRLLHSYVPKKAHVPRNEPTNAGCTPPYNPRPRPSCRHIVWYVLPMDVYFGGMCGSPCCRVFTVSRECISISPVVPPIPPARIACETRSITFGASGSHEAAYMDIGRPRHFRINLDVHLFPHIRHRSDALHRGLSGPLTIVHQLVWIRRAEPVGCASKDHGRCRDEGCALEMHKQQKETAKEREMRVCGMAA